MALEKELVATPAQAPPAREIEWRSLDSMRADGRHGRLWHRVPHWFPGDFQYFSIPARRAFANRPDPAGPPSVFIPEAV
jgi:hypothetical protein